MPLPITGEVLNLGDVSFLFFDNFGVITCYRRVVATTRSSSFIAPGILLVVLVLLWVGGGNVLSER